MNQLEYEFKGSPTDLDIFMEELLKKPNIRDIISLKVTSNSIIFKVNLVNSKLIVKKYNIMCVFVSESISEEEIEERIKDKIARGFKSFYRSSIIYVDPDNRFWKIICFKSI